MISNKSVLSTYRIPDTIVRAGDAEIVQSSFVSVLRLEPGSSVQGVLANELFLRHLSTFYCEAKAH